MKLKFIYLFVLIGFSQSSVVGQNLLFIGEYSFSCSETSTLTSDSEKYFINDLNIVFAKYKRKTFLAVSTETSDVYITGKLIIYLNDGRVISLANQIVSDYVNNISSVAYHIPIEDLEIIKASNINKVRFTLTDEFGSHGAFGGNFTASNNSKLDFSALISSFFR